VHDGVISTFAIPSCSSSILEHFLVNGPSAEIEPPATAWAM
jgi:hypothetical protein